MNTKTKETPHVKINNHHQIYNDTCSINTDCDTSFESPGDYHFCTNCTCNTQMTSVVQVSTELQHFHQKNNTSSRRDSLTDFKKSIIQSIRNSFSSKTNASTNAPLSKKHTAVSPDIKNSTLKEAAVTHSTENSENEEPLKKETLNPILPRRQQSTVELPVYDQTLSICRNSSQEIVVFSGLKDSLLTSLETTNSIETTAYAAKQKFIESDDLKPQSILKKLPKCKNKKIHQQFRFNEIVLVGESWSKDDYERKGDLKLTLTPALAFFIRQELNEFKAQMDVHPLSAQNTHFYR